MINLLPRPEKMAIKKEYKMRVYLVTLMFAFFITVVSLIVILPSFILSHYRAQITVPVAKVSTTTEESQSIANTIKLTKELTEVLKPEEAKSQPTDLLDVIIKDKTAGNTITSFAYSKDDKGDVKIVIQGLAQTRQSMLAFTNAVQKEVLVDNVNLPIANLTKDTKIPFSFEVTAKK